MDKVKDDALARLHHHARRDPFAQDQADEWAATVLAELADLRQQLAAAEADIAYRDNVIAGHAADTRQYQQRIMEAIAERDRAVKNDERLREWVCHNGGLIETWAQEWIPRGGRETLTAFIRRRLDAAIAAGGEEKS